MHAKPFRSLDIPRGIIGKEDRIRLHAFLPADGKIKRRGRFVRMELRRRVDRIEAIILVVALMVGVMGRYHVGPADHPDSLRTELPDHPYGSFIQARVEEPAEQPLRNFRVLSGPKTEKVPELVFVNQTRAKGLHRIPKGLVHLLQGGPRKAQETGQFGIDMHVPYDDPSHVQYDKTRTQFDNPP